MESIKTIAMTASLFLLVAPGYALAQAAPDAPQSGAVVSSGGAVNSSRGAVNLAPSAVKSAPSAVNAAPSAVNSAPSAVEPSARGGSSDAAQSYGAQH